MPIPKWEKVEEIEARVEAKVDSTLSQARSNKRTWLLLALAATVPLVVGWFWG